MKYTIKDLSEGRCAVINDGTLEDLDRVLKLAFPQDPNKVVGACKFYFSIISTRWSATDDYDYLNLPTQSVKLFLEELDGAKDSPTTDKIPSTVLFCQVDQTILINLTLVCIDGHRTTLSFDKATGEIIVNLNKNHSFTI